MKSDSAASVLLFIVVACLLALAACQDRSSVEPSAGAPEPEKERAAHRPAGSPGAAAGTAEGKKMAEKDPVKRAEFDEKSLAARVKAALSADPALGETAVNVSASGETVTLMGTADNVANREKATRVALGVQGVSSVENQLVVPRES
jgi:osmotically-inducible protein OsmY